MRIMSFISWEIAYLLIFTASNVLNLVWSSSIGSTVKALVPLVLVGIAFFIKMALMYKKVTWRTFWQMQLDFISPYVLTIINMILTFQIGVSFNYNAQSKDLFNNFQPDMNTYFVLEGVQYLMVTILCSLIMNKKSTSRKEFYFFLLNIILQAVGSLLMTIFYIQNLNQISDLLLDAIDDKVQYLITGTIQSNEYEELYKELSSILSAFDSAKDYALASLASIIAVLIILIDMIGRPFQKQEQHEEIIEEFVKHNASSAELKPNEKDSLEIQILKKQQMELFSLLEDSYQQLKVKLNEQNLKNQDQQKNSIEVQLFDQSQYIELNNTLKLSQ